MPAYPNPFRYGGLAQDKAFADREEELAELRKDVLNGQDVVIFAPRRYGKSSLIWRVGGQLRREKVLLAQVDLMTTPTVERLAEKLAKAIHEDIASPLLRAKDRLQVFRGLRIAPVVTVDPEDGSVGFSFQAARRPEDVDATLERLGGFGGDDQELRDAIARAHLERLVAVGVEQQDAHLAAVARVDQARSVDERDPVARREPRAGQHQAGVTIRDLDGDAGRHGRPLAGSDPASLGGVQVEARVTGMGAGRKPCVLGQPRDP